MRNYTEETASRFAESGKQTKPRAMYRDGKIVQYWPCQARSWSGVRFNRLLRFSKRCLRPAGD